VGKVPKGALAKSISLLHYPRNLAAAPACRLFHEACRALPELHFGKLKYGFVQKFIENVDESDCDDETGKVEAVMNGIWEQHMSLVAPEGVAYTSGSPAPDLLERLNGLIDELKANTRKDYHPGTKDIVRDLVHPSLYPLIREAPPSTPAEWSTVIANSPEPSDLWGRPYESSKYQWLPAEVDVSPAGKCTFQSPINNLPSKFKDLHSELAALLALSLPYLEAVWGYGREITFHDGDDEDMDSDLEEVWPATRQLKGKRLQVIVKIVDYELPPGASHEGVWHVEGMSHENIVASAIHVLRKDAGLVGGELAFKRAFLAREAGYIFGNIPQCRPQAAERVVEEGLVPLGTVQLPAGRMVCFPNSHVHRLSELKNTGEKDAVRRIVVFWLINPDRRIASTQDVPLQQETMTWEDAVAHRLQLMEERKLHKQDWNVREISLCEH